MILYNMFIFFVVEGVLKLNPIVESICVVVRSDQIFSTAIIVPDSNNLLKFAEEKLKKSGLRLLKSFKEA